MSKYCYIDFEYRRSNEEQLDLVSVSFKPSHMRCLSACHASHKNALFIVAIDRSGG